MDCQQARELLDNGPHVPELAAHLAGCAECAALARVVAVAADVPEEDVPLGFDARLRDRLEAVGRRRRAGAAALAAAGAAAVVLLAAVAGLRGARAPHPGSAGPAVQQALPGSGAAGAGAGAPEASRGVQAPVAGPASGPAGVQGAIASAPAAPSSPSPAGAPSAGLPDLAERKVIQEVSLTLEVDDVARAFDQIGQMAAAQGGFVAQASWSRGAPSRPVPGPAGRATNSASLTVRVPADALEGFLAGLGQLGRVTAESRSARDATQQYVDLGARLDALRAEEAAYQRLYGQAKNVGDILQIEEQLTRVRSQIDALEAERRTLERLASLATVQVVLTQADAASGSRPGPGFVPALTRSWQLLTGAAGALAVALGWILPWALLAALVAGGAVAGRRLVTRRTHRRG